MRHLFLFIISLFAVIGTINARKVTGEVVCDGDGICKVIVTDGKSFTTTKDTGKFSFNIKNDAEFVYIITPAGYVAEWSSGTPEFYQTAKGKKHFRFELKKTENGEKGYNLIAVGDPQPRNDKHFEEFIGNPLEDIRRTASSLTGQSVGLVLGDICFDALHLQKRWKKEITRAGIPFYPSVGNHDHDRAFNNDKESIHAYRENFGPENYAFFIGNDVVIVVDNIIYHSKSGYEEGYTDEIVDWVKKFMKYVPETASVYVAQHSPMNGRYHVKKNNEMNIVNHERFADIFTGFKVTFLSGHNHINGNFRYNEDMIEHNIAAICGTWWDAYHCKDGTPRGYKVYTKKDGELSWYYKSIDKDPDFQYEIFLPGTTRRHPEHIVVNIWDYDPQWDAVWFEDGKSMGKLIQVEDYSPLHTAELEARYAGTGKKVANYKKTGLSKHFFAAKPSADAKEITIVITNPFGKTWKETIKLKN